MLRFFQCQRHQLLLLMRLPLRQQTGFKIRQNALGVTALRQRYFFIRQSISATFQIEQSLDFQESVTTATPCKDCSFFVCP